MTKMLQQRLKKVTEESDILHVNKTQEQKEAEYKKEYRKLILLAYYWWRERLCKHWFSAPVKYFDFSTPRMEQILFMRALDMQPAHVKLYYKHLFPQTNKHFEILEACPGDYKIKQMTLYRDET